jgi:hypothetical protein
VLRAAHRFHDFRKEPVNRKVHPFGLLNIVAPIATAVRATPKRPDKGPQFSVGFALRGRESNVLFLQLDVQFHPCKDQLAYRCNLAVVPVDSFFQRRHCFYSTTARMVSGAFPSKRLLTKM